MQKAVFRNSNFKQFEGLDCVSIKSSRCQCHAPASHAFVVRHWNNEPCTFSRAFEANGGNPFEENATELVNILGLVCSEKGVRNLKDFEAVGRDPHQYTEFYKDVFKKGGGGLSKTIKIRKKKKKIAREIRITVTQDRNI